MWEKQTTNLYEEAKYAKESTKNYGDRVRYVLAVLTFVPL